MDICLEIDPSTSLSTIYCRLRRITQVCQKLELMSHEIAITQSYPYATPSNNHHSQVVRVASSLRETMYNLVREGLLLSGLHSSHFKQGTTRILC